MRKAAIRSESHEGAGNGHMSRGGTSAANDVGSIAGSIVDAGVEIKRTKVECLDAEMSRSEESLRS
jgi:outer membrane lipoprotein SlyB